jgi:hypothetical protein
MMTGSEWASLNQWQVFMFISHPELFCYPPDTSGTSSTKSSKKSGLAQKNKIELFQKYLSYCDDHIDARQTALKATIQNAYNFVSALTKSASQAFSKTIWDTSRRNIQDTIRASNLRRMYTPLEISDVQFQTHVWSVLIGIALEVDEETRANRAKTKALAAKTKVSLFSGKYKAAMARMPHPYNRAMLLIQQSPILYDSIVNGLCYKNYCNTSQRPGDDRDDASSPDLFEAQIDVEEDESEKEDDGGFIDNTFDRASAKAISGLFGED